MRTKYKLLLVISIIISFQSLFGTQNIQSNLEFRLSIIHIKKSNQAKEILQKLDQGMDFAKLASLYSIGSERFNDGDIGYIAANSLSEEFKSIVLNLKIKQHSQIIEASSGFYIILKTDQNPKEYKAVEPREQLTNIAKQKLARKAILDFFKNWQDKKYNDMYLQLLQTGDEKGNFIGIAKNNFLLAMKHSPVNFRNLAIKKVSPVKIEDGNEFIFVDISVEVTDIPSLIAAFKFAERSFENIGYMHGINSREKMWMFYTPKFLNIETYEIRQEEWILTNQNNYWNILYLGEGPKLINFLMNATPAVNKKVLIHWGKKYEGKEFNGEIMRPGSGSIMYYTALLIPKDEFSTKKISSEYAPEAEKKFQKAFKNAAELYGHWKKLTD